jgi:hypothetical protein
VSADRRPALGQVTVITLQAGERHVTGELIRADGYVLPPD